jgi:hypothetical protein
VCLAVAQIQLDCPSERRFLRFAMIRLSPLPLRNELARLARRGPEYRAVIDAGVCLDLR